MISVQRYEHLRSRYRVLKNSIRHLIVEWMLVESKYDRFWWLSLGDKSHCQPDQPTSLGEGQAVVEENGPLKDGLIYQLHHCIKRASITVSSRSNCWCWCMFWDEIKTTDSQVRNKPSIQARLEMLRTSMRTDGCTGRDDRTLCVIHLTHLICLFTRMHIKAIIRSKDQLE